MQQNGRKKRTAKVCVWQMWQDYYLNVLSTCFTKRSDSRKVKIGKKLLSGLSHIVCHLLSSPILFQCSIMIRKKHCPVSLITRWALEVEVATWNPGQTTAAVTLIQGPKKTEENELSLFWHLQNNGQKFGWSHDHTWDKSLWKRFKKIEFTKLLKFIALREICQCCCHRKYLKYGCHVFCYLEVTFVDLTSTLRLFNFASVRVGLHSSL